MAIEYSIIAIIKLQDTIPSCFSNLAIGSTNHLPRKPWKTLKHMVGFQTATVVVKVSHVLSGWWCTYPSEQYESQLEW